MKIVLTSVFVPDPSEAFRFYTEVLGFTERMYMPEAQIVIVASPEDAGGTGLLLEPNENPIAETNQKGLFEAEIPCITFGVEDIEREHQRLTEKGVVFRKPPTKEDWGIGAVFEDTCGNLIQLTQT